MMEGCYNNFSTNNLWFLIIAALALTLQAKKWTKGE